MINYKLNFSSISSTLLAKGLKEQNTEKTVVGVSACLKRPPAQEDLELLKDIVEVFKTFPGTVVGADTPVKVLLGKHRMGKSLPLYGSYAPKQYSGAHIRAVAFEVETALRETGCIISGASGYGPDHTFVPASKDAIKFTNLQNFLAKLPSLPKTASTNATIKIDKKNILPFIDDLRKVTLKTTKSTGPETFCNIFEGTVDLFRKQQSNHFTFTKVAPYEVTRIQRTPTENIFSITVQDIGITDGMRQYAPTINIALDKDGNMQQWDAGWAHKTFEKKHVFFRSQELEKEIEQIPSFNLLKTPDIDI